MTASNSYIITGILAKKVTNGNIAVIILVTSFMDNYISMGIVIIALTDGYIIEFMAQIDSSITTTGIVVMPVTVNYIIALQVS